MRVSSVMRAPSSGTLKSTRTSTRLLFTSISRIVFLFIRIHRGQVYYTVPTSTSVILTEEFRLAHQATQQSEIAQGGSLTLIPRPFSQREKGAYRARPSGTV